MHRLDGKIPTLPRGLKEEIGIKGSAESPITSKYKQNGPSIRKERRKAARTAKTIQRPSGKPKTFNKHETASTSSSTSRLIRGHRQIPVDQLPSQKSDENIPRKSILKSPKKKNLLPEDNGVSSPPIHSSPRHISRGVMDRLAADDAEIAALEKALGVKDKKKLPSEEDGLDGLLDGLGEVLGAEVVTSKRKRDDGEEWLESKRKKARLVDREVVSRNPSALDDGDGMDDTFNGLSDPDIDEEAQHGSNRGVSSGNESTDDASSRDHSIPSSGSKAANNVVRENPYRAPVTAELAVPKYKPPSLRVQDLAQMDDLSRLRAKVQGLINRLSEANLISILDNVESLYQYNPRQHLSSTLLDLLLGLLSDTANLQDTFVILHAGFITAVYKMIGPDFGAQVVQRIDEEFRLNFDAGKDDGQIGKKLTNLASLLSSLYTFQVIDSHLIFDYIRMFIEGLSEAKVELLLKILRNSGPQLRQDNPSALKEIIQLVHKAVGKIGEEHLSVRTKFMIETINQLKNNRLKTGAAASTITSEHVIRMKKTLGSLNTRSVKASEPLRIGVSDIRESDKRGKWWLVGASYKGPMDDTQDKPVPGGKAGSLDSLRSDLVQDAADDLLQIARDQGMNTGVRQAIFKIIMSASDYNNAFQLLMNLGLKKTQEPEIAKVIIHCAGVEQAYNPYYSLLSRRLCASRGNYKMTFQFSLWGLFKRFGDGPDADQDEAEEDGETLPMRSIINVAKMFGTLIAEGGTTLSILKNKVLGLPYLQPKTSIFVEVMIVAIILHSHGKISESRNESRLMETFAQVKGNPPLAQGLQRFLKKTVSRTDIAGTKAENQTVKWGCRVASNALDAEVSLGIVQD
ncbi:MAG: hypothetical protein Q9168_001097 [Polycauliona sp. 1 TL-2023]